jgi:hypothetical protein
MSHVLIFHLAPLKDVHRAVQNGSLGQLNPTPWALMTGNTLGWITYSYLLHVSWCDRLCMVVCRRLTYPHFIYSRTALLPELLHILCKCAWVHIFHLAQYGSSQAAIL